MFWTSLLACESCLQLLRLEGFLESLQVSSAMICHVFVNPTVCMLHGFSSVLPREGPEMSRPILPMEPPTAAHPRKCRCEWCVHLFERNVSNFLYILSLYLHLHLIPSLYSPRELTYPLKINGWKMKFPFEMVPFSGDMLIFRGGKSLVLWSFIRMISHPKPQGIADNLLLLSSFSVVAFWLKKLRQWNARNRASVDK